jgi:hypothetical protein
MVKQKRENYVFFVSKKNQCTWQACWYWSTASKGLTVRRNLLRVCFRGGTGRQGMFCGCEESERDVLLIRDGMMPIGVNSSCADDKPSLST